MAENQGVWQPIETAPKGQTIIGINLLPHHPAVIVGELYELRENAILDQWRGRWLACSHWQPLPKTSEPNQ